MTKAENIAVLLYKELEGKLSEAEANELLKWRTESPEHTTFFEEVMDEDRLTAIIKLHHPENQEVMRKTILAKMEAQLDFKVVPIYRRSFFRIAVAACIALLISAGGYFLFFNKKETLPPVAMTNDITPPASNKAIITLPDGKIISLDTLTTYSQGTVSVTKTKDGRLVYTGFGSEVQFNTLTNPRGSKIIDMTLADGSHVWLNAGSSLTYPVSFAGNERKVSMTGEAFFSVAHNTAMPFTVTKADMHVTVLGTEFNVNAYDDEAAIKVTLLKGSVNINKGVTSALLKPGQQAQVASDVKVVNNINTEAVTAWKKGMFSFDNADLKTIMRQLAVWYDVDVEYNGAAPPQRFGGEMPRTSNLSQVLEILKTSGVRFTIEGRKVTIRT